MFSLLTANVSTWIRLHLAFEGSTNHKFNKTSMKQLSITTNTDTQRFGEFSSLLSVSQQQLPLHLLHLTASICVPIVLSVSYEKPCSSLLHFQLNLYSPLHSSFQALQLSPHPSIPPLSPRLSAGEDTHRAVMRAHNDVCRRHTFIGHPGSP